MAAAAPVVVVGGEATASAWFVEEPTPVAGQAAGSGASTTGSWRLLRKADQARLEAAAAAVGQERPPSVLVDSGRAEVWLSDRLLVERYGTVPPTPPCAVRRALWLRRPAGESWWEPYEEACDAAIEAAYQELLQNARNLSEVPGRVANPAPLARSVALAGEKASVNLKLRLVSDPAEEACRRWELTAEEKPSTWLQAAQTSLLRRATAVKRGFAEVPMQSGEAEEEALGHAIGRLIVLVHGSGASGAPDLCAREFRRDVQQCQLQLAGFTRVGPEESYWERPADAPGEAPRPKKDEVVEVCWSQRVLKGDLRDALGRIALPGAGEGRTVAQTALAEAVLMAHPGRRAAVMAAVAEGVEGALAMVRGCRPDFAGKVVLVGHGVAGAAVFELLREAKLSFVPQALFLLGSPLPALLQMCGEVPLSPTLALPRGTRVLNVFQPEDPLAYRLEPLLAPEWAKEPPAEVPADAKHVARRLLMCDCKAPPLALNTGARVDWALPAGAAPARQDEALSVHDACLRVPELAAFVQAASATLAGWGTDGSLEDFLTSDSNWAVVPPTEEAEGGVLGGWSLDTARKQLRHSATTGALGLAAGLSRKWEETGAATAASQVADVVARKCKETGATDVVVGTYHAATGVVGAARAVGGTVRLVGTAVGAAGGVVNLARTAAAARR